MATEAEHKIPNACPECKTVLASNYKSHCGQRWCGWVECGTCHEIICTRSGRHKPGGSR